MLSKKNMEISLNMVVLLAVVSQFSLPMPAKAATGFNLANSTEKLAIEAMLPSMTPVEKPALPAKPAVKAKAKAKSRKPISKAAINSPGESVKLTLAEGQKPDKVMTAAITAYNSVPGQTDDSPFIAATGKRVHDSMIAANKLPFGTKIKIPSLYGDKIFVVEDRMNSRYGLGRMDIWMESVPEARKFGIKRVEVEIYYPKKAVVKADR